MSKSNSFRTNSAVFATMLAASLALEALAADPGVANRANPILQTLVFHEITAFKTSPNSGNATSPKICKNGNKIVYSTAATGGINQTWVINNDGTGQLMVDSYTAGCFCSGAVDISDDGSKVLECDAVQLRSVNSDGTSATPMLKLTSNEISSIHIAGNSLKAFINVRRDATIAGSNAPLSRGLYSINLDGTGLTLIAGPIQVGAVVSTLPGNIFPFENNNSSGSTLDSSADGTKIIFVANVGGTATVKGDILFAVNSDGTGLRQLIGPSSFTNQASLNAAGTKVGYAFLTFSTNVSETGVVNFDGTGRLVLSTTLTTNSPDRYTISSDGTKFLAGSSSNFYNTDGSGVLQLAVSFGGFSNDPAAILGTGGMYLATMNNAANRFAFLRQDSAGINQIITMDINPTSVGLAPTITNPTANPNFVLINRGSATTVTAQVAATGTLRCVANEFLFNGIDDPNCASLAVLLDDGTQGDVKAGDGIFTNNALTHGFVIPARTPETGPRIGEVKAENLGTDGKRHATVVSYSGFSVLAAPTAAPVINSSPSASGAVGTAFMYSIAATNFPISFAATGLPAGLSVSATTGIISGTPTAAGTSTVTISATNAVGTGTATLTLNISATAVAVTFSDSFNRADADRCTLGALDNALGGSGTLFYLPIFPTGGTNAANPIGANIVSNALQNNGLDFGGVQFCASAGACTDLTIRGKNVGQDLNMKMDLRVPTDSSGRVTRAGPYFRSRAAAAGDGIIGGTSAGYWVQLLSTGDVQVKQLNPQAFVAVTAKPASFDNTTFHNLQIAAGGSSLQVVLDGVLQTFTQNGASVTSVSIPATSGSNDGTAGIAFSAEDNRGLIGGQRADNLVVSSFSPFTSPPTITSGPTVLGVSTVAGFPVVLSVAADQSTTFTWNFGDGSPTVTGGTVSHTYTTPGTFTITLTSTNSNLQTTTKTLNVTVVALTGSASSISSNGSGFPDEILLALGLDPTNPASTPFGGAPAGTPLALTISKLSIKLNFAKSGTDSITLNGTLHVPAGFVVANQTVVLDVGGVVKSFTLNSKGSSPSGSNDSFKITIKAKKNVVLDQDAKFTVKLNKGSFQTALTDEGLISTTAKNSALTVPVIVLFNQSFYRKDQPQLYTANPGKTGVTK